MPERPAPVAAEAAAAAGQTAPQAAAPASADLFCRVVDNFGDAGVCWRLARRLAVGHGMQVRLWIDQPATLSRFVEPDRADRELLASGRIVVAEWSSATTVVEPADLVIETFGCDIPPAYAEALAARGAPVRWYNLEYLSAEDWVDACHALPSPHPRLALSRTFFFPGFSAATGGLLREPGLIERRRAAQLAAPGMAAPGAGRAPAETRPAPDGREVDRPGAGHRPAISVGVFCYPDAPLPALLDALAQGADPVRLRLFQGPAQDLARDWEARHPGHRLDLDYLPWMGQDGFDQVLWSCDFNIVRGEDSFVRAQWAGRPLLWDIYPQRDDAHLVKMAAFLRRYREGMEPACAEALGGLWQPWVRREADRVAAAWTALAPRLVELRRHAEHWCDTLAARPELVDALLAHAGLD